MGGLSEDTMDSLYVILDSLREICEHRNVELKDVIALYQAYAINRGVDVQETLLKKQYRYR